MKKQKTQQEITPWIVTVPLAFSTYGRMLAYIRTSKGLSQSQLARKLNTKQSAIARMENAKTPPSLRRMKEIATALKMSMTAPYFACKKCKKNISECVCRKNRLSTP